MQILHIFKFGPAICISQCDAIKRKPFSLACLFVVFIMSKFVFSVVYSRIKGYVVINQLSGSRQAVVWQFSCSRHAVVIYSSGSHHAVVMQLSGIPQAFLRQSLGSRQAVIWQSSGSRQVVIN